VDLELGWYIGRVVRKKNRDLHQIMFGVSTRISGSRRILNQRIKILALKKNPLLYIITADEKNGLFGSVQWI
jgi:hypothetical protein